MPGVVDVYRRAMEQFGGLLREVRPDQWHAPTPCEEWDVHALANHLIGENRWVPPLLEGKTIADVGDALDGDLLGDDPPQAWEAAAAEAAAAAAQPGALERTVHLSFGDFPGRYYLGQVASDHVIHAWDLARAIGAAETLDPDLVRFAYEELAPQLDAWRDAGAFGPPAEVHEGADLQAKLLAASGRRV